MAQPSTGTHIKLHPHRCRGPVTIEEGLRAAINRAVKASGVHMLGQVKLRRFPDGTANIQGDLTESHFSGGTYKKQRFIQLDVVMCNETSDNTELARTFARALIDELRPSLFHKRRDWKETYWKSL